MLEIVLETFAYLGVGLVMMMLGYFIIDLFIPIDFPQEINDGNKSVGWVSAGIYAALGFVIRSAIISNTYLDTGVTILYSSNWLKNS
jgi:putative membrane protein